jgi:predicted nuclease of restriction endonuclease-like (RecB) superfamily
MVGEPSWSPEPLLPELAVIADCCGGAGWFPPADAVSARAEPAVAAPEEVPAAAPPDEPAPAAATPAMAPSMPAAPAVRAVTAVLSVTDLKARRHYQEEALRGGWSVRQLDRQISTLSFQRSRTGHLKHGSAENSPDTDIKDPFVLEFLGLKDEYSESELEDALIRELEQFLLELGNDFAFIARQKRLRVGTEWYRVDLLFFHRGLRSLIVVELKLGKFTHADAGYGKPDVMKSAA